MMVGLVTGTFSQIGEWIERGKTGTTPSIQINVSVLSPIIFNLSLLFIELVGTVPVFSLLENEKCGRVVRAPRERLCLPIGVISC